MSITVRRLSGFGDSTVGAERWNALHRRSPSNVVHLTWQWQAAWWDALGRGELMLFAAERDGDLIAIAPFYADTGMILFVGSGDSCYLDFIGDVEAPRAIETLLQAARDACVDFVGFRFYGLPSNSPTCAKLPDAAAAIGLDCYRQREWAAWTLDLTHRPRACAMTRKKSLVRHENFFRRTGSLEVWHTTRGDDIAAELDAFFAQHIERRSATSHPSAFTEPAQRRFAERWVALASHTGWLRFTRVTWNSRPIAYHLGNCYDGRYCWAKPTFALDLARRSPGEVLMRQLLLAALDESAHTFDFGTGDDPFKARFATAPHSVVKWGLFPKTHTE